MCLFMNTRMMTMQGLRGDDVAAGITCAASRLGQFEGNGGTGHEHGHEDGSEK
jgi:hypothetical protein